MYPIKINHTNTPSFRRQWLLLTIALLVVGGLIAYYLGRQYVNIERLEKERLTVQAKVVGENLGRQLEGIDQALLGIQSDMHYWSEAGDQQAASRHLQMLSAAMPGVRTLLVLNAEGIVTASDRAELIGKNFRQRAYFKVAEERADPAILHVLPPFKTSLGVYAIVLARCVMDANGKFAGVVSATLDPDYFTILLDSVRYAPDMRVSLTHGAGIVFQGVPPPVKKMNMDLAKPGTFYTRHVESGQIASLFSGTVYANGEDRMMALRTIRPATIPMDQPLMVAVSRQVSAIFAPLQRDAYFLGGLFALLVLTTTLSLLFRQRQLQAYARLAASQEVECISSEQALRYSERFQSMLVDAIPGLVGYWTEDLCCTFANKEYQTWFGKRPEEMRGIRFSDLLGEDLFRQNEPFIRSALRGEAQRFERIFTKANGEVCHALVHYLPDIDSDSERVRGFFVLVSDISALKTAQFQLEKLNQDLTLRTAQAEEAIADYQRTELELRIVATAFDSQQAMMIASANNVILRVNRAFTDNTGYTSGDIVGQTPRRLRSGRHDKVFYHTMWESINRTGAWQGEIWIRRKSGEIYLNWMTFTAVKGADGALTHYVGTMIDITSRKAAEEEVKHLAFYDPLTGLPNRRLLMDRLRQALTKSLRNGRDGALMFLDMDNFKTLNDTLGHDRGDLLLQQVAQRLPACLRESDTVARLGGDEFVVMLEELGTNPQEAATQIEAIGEKILAALNQPYNLAGHPYHSTASIGVALFSDSQNTIEELMKRADLAMYQAKAAGRNTQRFFDPQMQAIVTAHAALEIELRQALQQNEFLLYYQPQVDGERRVTGVEALVRWRHPQRGLVSPAEFIPLAEETGLILPLGHWVLESACNQLAAWAAQPQMAHLTMAVNISARQFYRTDFVERVLAVLNVSGARPQQLKLELTESLLLDDMEDIIIKMTALKARGVGFSLDDFGIGYSSLSYLKRLPLDQLKIDQSFVRDVLTDSNDAAIARTIVALGQSLGLAVIAEGVETEEQRIFLANHGCDAYQGYLFSRPLPVKQFEQFIQDSAACSAFGQIDRPADQAIC